MVLKTPEEYFDRKYGKDWDEYAYFDDEKIKLTNSMRQAAKPKEVVDKKCVSQCILKVKNMPDVKSYLAKKTKTCSRTGVCYNNFIEKMGVYVINCQMHKVRYDKFKDYANKAGLKACRIPCVLGSKFTNEILCEMVDKKLLSKTADMNAIEVSINMSHFNAWQKISNSCLKYGLILEDDVEVTEDFIDRVNEILEKLEEKDISFSTLFLYGGNWMKTISSQTKILKINEDIEIVKQNEKFNEGGVAYIISKEYINFLIERFFPIKEPQDILLGSYPKHGNHLLVKMKYDKREKCYISPLLNIECGGPGGTGNTTQDYEAPTMKEKSCKKC
jgi:GR25 family glycosyltransferase involved in LPS biosynthesis